MAAFGEGNGGLMAIVICEHHTMEDGYLPFSHPMVLDGDGGAHHACRS